MPAVSVIVPARDCADTLPATLTALQAQEVEGGFEVLVVDDGSRDDTPAIAKAAGDPVRCLAGSGAGAAAARNLGAASCSSPLLAFTDSDCQPAPGWLEHGTRALADADLVQGRVLPTPGVAMGPFDRSLWVTAETGLYEAANLFVTRRTFERVGGFAESTRQRTGRPMGEDTWFGWQARRAGARTAFRPEALVHHAVFPRTPREYVAERQRLLHFPELARQVPELRRTLGFARLFLSRRTAAFDAALAGCAVAVAARRPAPLVATLPYLREVRRRTGAHPGAVRVALVDLAADAVGLAALVRGTIRARCPLL